jgi:hypothetical protein
VGFSSAFKVTTAAGSPFDAASGSDPKTAVSNFITIQSFTNFAAMTGAIAAAWRALQVVVPGASTLWVPYGLALFWGAISVLMSLDGIKGSAHKIDLKNLAVAIFLGFLNSLALAGAVVGTNSIGAAAAKTVTGN